MSGFYKKAVVWLGLNEEYPDDVSSLDAPSAEATPTERAQQRDQRGVGPDARSERAQAQRRAESRPDPLARNRNAHDRSEGTVRAIPIDEPTTPAASIGTVRAVAIPRTTKPQLIIPKSFNDAQEVADAFRDSKPVIVNMQNAERDLARRLIDFSSGLCYGLGGQMEKVAKDVYLLTPDEVEVADEERQNFNP
jgi:cell division inhibitor SepF